MPLEMKVTLVRGNAKTMLAEEEVKVQVVIGMASQDEKRKSPHGNLRLHNL